MQSLILKDISRVYPNKGEVICKLSYEFSPGFYIIRGNNGSGKTTLIKILADLVKESSGVIERNFSVSYMPSQENSFSFRLSGEENLRLFDISLECLPSELLNLETFKEALKTKYFKCSSGMKQCLSFARLIGQEADLYLLDEPTRGMDDQLKSILFSSISTLVSKNKIVLLSTHESIDTKQSYTELKLEGGRLV